MMRMIPINKRYNRGYYIGNNKKSWQRFVTAMVEQKGIAGRKKTLSLLLKIFAEFLKLPFLRYLFPLKPNPLAQIDGEYELILRGFNKKWIAFNFRKNHVTRIYSSSWSLQKEIWIRKHQEIAPISPQLLEYNTQENLLREEFIRGERLNKERLEAGIKAIRQLWPQLSTLYNSRTRRRKLRMRHKIKREETRNLLYQAGLKNLWQTAVEKKVLHGICHGDLKQSNILIQNQKPFIIDWGERYRLAPPFFDLLYFLYRYTERVEVEKIASSAYEYKDWYRKNLPAGSSPDAVRVSLVAVVYKVSRKLIKEDNNNPRKKRLSRFLQQTVESLSL